MSNVSVCLPGEVSDTRNEFLDRARSSLSLSDQGNPTPQTGLSSGGVAEIRIPRLPYFASTSRLLSTLHPCLATSEYPASSLGVPCHTRTVRLLIRRVMGIGGRVRSYILVLVGRRGSHILPHRHGRKEKPGAQRERGLEPGTYCSTTISPTPGRPRYDFLSDQGTSLRPAFLALRPPTTYLSSRRLRLRLRRRRLYSSHAFLLSALS